MLILGVILFILSWPLHGPLAVLCFWLGLILIIVGLVLNFGPPLGTGPRRRYW